MIVGSAKKALRVVGWWQEPSRSEAGAWSLEQACYQHTHTVQRAKNHSTVFPREILARRGPWGHQEGRQIWAGRWKTV